VIEELAETNWKSVWRRERVMGSDLGSAARRDFHSSGSARGKRKSPRLIVKSAPGKPFDFDIEPIDALRLVTAFGTTEPSFASWMLNGIINAACDGGSANPPGAEAINDALAAVTGIGARDETEGMLATQMVATHSLRLALCGGLKAQRQFLSRTATAT
jgi:hypothetical protein